MRRKIDWYRDGTKSLKITYNHTNLVLQKNLECSIFNDLRYIVYLKKKNGNNCKIL